MKVINVMASSLDGCIAAHKSETDYQRSQYHLTSKADQDFVRSQIKDADAIITGANSLRASSYLRDDKNKQGKFPLWTVLTTKGLDKDLGFWGQGEFRRWLVSPEPVELYDSAVENYTYTDKNPATFVYQKLKDAGMRNVLLFGGGRINALFYKAGLVAELRLTLSPVIVGSIDPARLLEFGDKQEALVEPKKLMLQAVEQQQSHLFLRYKILH